MPLPSFRCSLRAGLRAAAFVALTGVAGLAAAQVDPPTRIAFVSHHEGDVRLADGRGVWQPLEPNLPLSSGSSVQLEPGARAELHSGFAALRLAGPAQLNITELSDDRTRLALNQGPLAVRLRQLEPGERFEIGTPNLALVAQQPGDYRIDVDPVTRTTRVLVRSGAATLYGEAGEAVTLQAAQTLNVGGRHLQPGPLQAPWADDARFDRWVASRNALEDQSPSALYVSPDVPGYMQLDAYGQWSQDPTYGAVWLPNVRATDWAPYRQGNWRWIDPWGWTWVDDAPWGFAPFHYGRWTQIGPRWAWVPGPRSTRSVYAPALVGFVGGSAGGSGWNVSLTSGDAGVAWFPLAPGEYWNPYYQASPRYRQRLNSGWVPVDRAHPPVDYRFIRQPQAITVVPHEQFGGHGERRPRYWDGSRIGAAQLANAAVSMMPPPRAQLPGRSAPPALGVPPRPEMQPLPEPRRPHSFDGQRPPTAAQPGQPVPPAPRREFWDGETPPAARLPDGRVVQPDPRRPRGVDAARPPVDAALVPTAPRREFWDGETPPASRPPDLRERMPRGERPATSPDAVAAQRQQLEQRAAALRQEQALQQLHPQQQRQMPSMQPMQPAMVPPNREPAPQRAPAMPAAAPPVPHQLGAAPAREAAPQARPMERHDDNRRRAQEVDRRLGPMF